MKKTCIIALCMLAGSAIASAQTFNLKEGQVTYSFDAAQAGEMTFGENNTLTIAGKTFELTGSTAMWIDRSAVENNVVTVTYADATAMVTVAGNVAQYVDVTAAGANVSVAQSGDVSAETCGEITYRLSGSSTDGSFYTTGSFKATIELDGLSLQSASGAPLDIQNGKRIALKMLDGTVNSLSDAAGGSQKGCIVCKGHLELKGSGSITVAGNTSHAIYAKEYIEMGKCTVTVTKAVKDGLNCNQYFLLKSGSLSIDNVGDDGIQVSFKDDTDREAEDTGAVTIQGGEITVNVSADAAKGIKCEGPMSITGGTLNVTVTGNGIWDEAKTKTKASASLASDEDIIIDGGTLTLTATGGGGKGINCDGNLTINGGSVNITTSGGVVAYVNNKLYTNYTGNTDNIASDYKSSPKGIKADGNLTINGGEINVKTTGNGGEGIESKSVLTINDGTVNINAKDDGINSSSHMYIKGGNVTVISTGNDGLDSNGNLYMQGGYVMAFGARSPECGIDANEEQGYSVIFSGGTLLAVGGNNSVPSSSSGSTQPFVKGSKSVSANMEITLSNSAGTTLATFTVPSTYSASGSTGGWGGSSGSSVLITCPGLTSGTSYTLKAGTSSSSVSATLTGSSGGRPGGH